MLCYRRRRWRVGQRRPPRRSRWSPTTTRSSTEDHQSSYGYFTIISPIIIYKQPLNFKTNLEFHSSGNILSEQLCFCSEIIVGEIIVKSPYEIWVSR